jgi:hypothetical protein
MADLNETRSARGSDFFSGSLAYQMQSSPAAYRCGEFVGPSTVIVGSDGVRLGRRISMRRAS